MQFGSHCQDSRFDEPNGNQQPDIASTLKELAQIYQSHQRFDDARLLLRKALLLEVLFLGKLHPQVAVTTAILAGLYREAGDLREATLLFKQALSITERQPAANQLLLSSLLSELSDCYRLQARYGEALRLGKQAERLRQAARC